MNLVKRLLATPYLWGAIALATLLLGLTPWVYPGEAATQMAQWLGVWEAGAGNAHPMAQGIFLGIAWIAPSVTAFNVANALFAALCVLYLCALVRWLIVLLTPEPRTAAHRLTAVAVGVPLAALALLLSPDFLRAGTHFQWQPLDLALTLATALHVCKTAYDGHHRRMFVAAFAIGVIALCSPWQLLLAPLLTVALGLGYFAAHDRVRIRPFVTCLLIPLFLGMAVVSGGAVCFALGAGASSATGALKAFVLTQALGTLEALRGPWLLMALFGVLPGILAPFVLGAVGANRRTLAVVGTYLSMAVLAAVTFLPLSVTPTALAATWGEAYPLLAAALVALAVGVTGGAGALLIAVRTPAEGGAERGAARALGRAVAWVAIPGAVVCLGVGAWGAVQAVRADATAENLPRAYADAILDRCPEGCHLLGDGVADPYLALRLAERPGAFLISLADDSERGRDRIREHLKADPYFADKPELRDRLRLSLDIGLIPFIQDWLRADEGACAHFATLSLPDLWYTGNRQPLPDGLLYKGAPTREAQSAALTPPTHVGDVLPAADAEIPEEASANVRAFAGYARRQVGFVANNVAFYLAANDKKDAAYDLFTQVYAYDPDNVSALFNIFELVNGGLHPEKKDWCEQEMNALIKRLAGRRIRLWALSRTYGYIRSPQLLSAIAGSWAMSGQTGAALSGMDLAMEMLGEGQQSAIQGAVAALYAMAPGRRGEAIARYKALLAQSTDPAQSLAYIRELIRMTLLENDLDEAQALLERAEAAGDPTALAYERALVHAAAGDQAKALESLNRYLDRFPKNLEANAMLATLQLQAGLLDDLRKHTRPRLVAAAGTEDSYFVQIIDAQLAEREGNLRRARACYLRALTLKPEVQALRNTVLALDIRLNDKASAARHARDFLYQDRALPLANYVMGSIALSEGDLDRALGYLTFATSPDANPPLPEAFNDLAETHRRMGDWAAALAAAQRACELAPKLPVAHETAAAALLGLKRYAEAHAELDTAINLDRELRPGQPTDPRFLITRARLHAAEGHPDLARAALAEARAQYDILDPGAKAEFDALDAQLKGEAAQNGAL